MGYVRNEECKIIINSIKHYINLGRNERVRKEAYELIKKYPECPEGYFYMALCQYYSNEVVNAIALCHKALKFGMHQLKVRPSLMLYYDIIGDYEKVDEQYNLIRELFPEYSTSNAIFGYSIWKRGYYEEGIKLIEESLANKPNDSMIINLLFIIAKKNKNKKQIRTLLKLYMDSDASDIDKTLMAGECEAQLGNWRIAKTQFKRGVEYDPLNPRAIYYLDICKWRLKYLPVLILFLVLWSAFGYIFKIDPSIKEYYFYYYIPVIIVLFIILINENEIANILRQ